MLSHDPAHRPSVGFPFFFFALLPVVFPEVVVGLEDGQVIDLDRDSHCQTRREKSPNDSAHILGDRKPSHLLVANHHRPHGVEADKGPLFELDDLSSVRCGSFREDVQLWADSLFDQLLAFLDLFECPSTSLTGGFALDPNVLSDLTDAAKTRYGFGSLIRHHADGVLQVSHQEHINHASVVRDLDSCLLFRIKLPVRTEVLAVIHA